MLPATAALDSSRIVPVQAVSEIYVLAAKVKRFVRSVGAGVGRRAAAFRRGGSAVRIYRATTTCAHWRCKSARRAVSAQRCSIGSHDLENTPDRAGHSGPAAR